MSINSKKKGNQGERELAKIFNTKFGEGKFKRTPMSGAFVGGKNQQSNINLSEEAKLTLVSDLITPIGFRFIVEHKFYKDINFWELFSNNSNWNHWIDQIEYDANFVKKLPLIIVKYNRHRRIALTKKKIPLNLITEYPCFMWGKYQVVLLKDLLTLPYEWWFEKVKI